MRQGRTSRPPSSTPLSRLEPTVTGELGKNYERPNDSSNRGKPRNSPCFRARSPKRASSRPMLRQPRRLPFVPCSTRCRRASTPTSHARRCRASEVRRSASRPLESKVAIRSTCSRSETRDELRPSRGRSRPPTEREVSWRAVGPTVAPIRTFANGLPRSGRLSSGDEHVVASRPPIALPDDVAARAARREQIASSLGWYFGPHSSATSAAITSVSIIRTPPRRYSRKISPLRYRSLAQATRSNYTDP